MHLLPKIFSHNTERSRDGMDSSTGRSRRTPTPRPKLDRRNAVKNINYNFYRSSSSASSSYSSEESPPSSSHPPHRNRKPWTVKTPGKTADTPRSTRYRSAAMSIKEIREATLKLWESGSGQSTSPGPFDTWSESEATVKKKKKSADGEIKLPGKLQMNLWQNFQILTIVMQLRTRHVWKQQYDEKNIRRRVYDALNVLMAMDIISKDKKEIQWKGLPRTSLNDFEELKNERLVFRNRIEKKAAYLAELEEQYVGLQSLIQRNAQQYGLGNAPSGGVALPFIMVQKVELHPQIQTQKCITLFLVDLVEKFGLIRFWWRRWTYSTK